MKGPDGLQGNLTRWPFALLSWRRSRYAVAAVYVLASVLIAACNRTPPTPPATPMVANATDPQWVIQAAPHAKVAVVFVHGVFGDTLGTWTNDNGETFFRLLRAQPDVGPQLDIFAFGFTSNMFERGSFDIREAANKLHDSLQYKGVLNYPTVVFVAHSMGGLVVLRDLLTRRELLDKVPLIVLYATPQEGAQIALIADYVAHNPALAQMLPADGNAYLQQLNDD
jgi:pimeloyl-ACP methyl ester carboxylesterase